MVSGKFLKSPLNYTGNKYRILSQIFKYFPNKVGTFVDVFCGGATVGINVNAERVIFIDSDERVISLLKYLSKCDFTMFLKNVNKTIEHYGLSCSSLNGYSTYINLKRPKNKNNGLKDYNKNGFYKLRNDYNHIKNKDSDKANLLLYLLLVYGFNNDLRFNSYGDYNLPCGKTDLNKFNIEKVKQFNEKSKKCNFTFICGDFRDPKIQKIILSGDFVYFDPPYLITDAVYNESSKWDIKTEKELISFLSLCEKTKVPFVLSNVLSKNRGAALNKVLNSWINESNKRKLVDIKYHYKSSSYNKINRDSNEREIIVVSN